MDLGQREGDALVLADRPVEHHPLLGVGHRPAQRRPADAEGLGGDEDPFGVEPVEQVAEARGPPRRPGRPPRPGGRRRRPRRTHRVAADLGDRRDRRPPGPAVGEEQRHAVGALGALLERRGAAQQQHPLRLRAPSRSRPCDPGYVLAVGSERRGCVIDGVSVPASGSVTPKATCRSPFATRGRYVRRISSEPCITTGCIPKIDRCTRRAPVHGRARGRHLFEDDRRLVDAPPAAPVGLGDGDADPAAVGHRGVELPGEFVVRRRAPTSRCRQSARTPPAPRRGSVPRQDQG